MDAIDVNTAESQTATQQKQAIVQALLGMVGATAGALVTNTVAINQTDNWNPIYNWIGAVLGAVLPELVTAVGPFPRLRLTAGLLVIGISLFGTYSGFALQARVAGNESSILPGPEPKQKSPEIIKPTPTPSPTALVTCEGNLCIKVTPILLHCSNGGCDSDITVKSAGTKPLRITGFGFDGPAAGRFHQDSQCVELGDLTKNGPCTITVRMDPGPAGKARLRIHQNLKGPASLVTLVATDATPPTSGTGTLDLSLSTTPVCRVDPGGGSNGGDSLTISGAVLNSIDQQLTKSVAFSLTSDTGLSSGGHISVSAETDSTPIAVDLSPANYSQAHQFTLTVDPADEIAETNESNNGLEVLVDLPARPNGPRRVPCTTN